MTSLSGKTSIDTTAMYRITAYGDDWVTELRAALGDAVFMHHAFARMGGEVFSFDLPLVRYSTDDRLHEIMAIYEAHGCPVSDPHSCTIDEGGMKTVEYRHLAWKRRLDLQGLLNTPGSHEWPRVGDMDPEATEAMHHDQDRKT